LELGVIEDYHFGQIQVEGKRYGGDIKIIAGRVVSDWWRKESHGLDVEDVDDILSAAPETLVVGMGLPGNMKVRSALRKILAETGVKLIEEPTEHAIHTFNDLYRAGRKVAGAFHLTC
jgi:hypothetical protein